MSRPRILLPVVEARRKTFAHFINAGRAKQVSRGDDKRAMRNLIIIVEHASQLVAQGCLGAEGERQLVGGMTVHAGRRFVGYLELGRIRARFALARVQPGLRGAQLRGQRLHRGRPRFQGLPHNGQRVPVAILQDRRLRSAGATLRPFATRDGRLILRHERRHRRVESVRTETVTRAMRGSAFHAVTPALDRAINNRGRLAVRQIERETLGRGDLLPIESVRHIDHVPIMQVSQLRRGPLHVLAGLFPVAAHPVGVDRRLVPIDMQNDVT